MVEMTDRKRAVKWPTEDRQSERSRRRVSLPSFTFKTLKSHRERQQSERLLAGSKWVETGLVLTSTIATALDERNRHTTATLLLGHAAPPRVVMETLGQ